MKVRLDVTFDFDETDLEAFEHYGASRDRFDIRNSLLSALWTFIEDVRSDYHRHLESEKEKR